MTGDGVGEFSLGVSVRTPKHLPLPSSTLMGFLATPQDPGFKSLVFFFGAVRDMTETEEQAVVAACKRQVRTLVRCGAGVAGRAMVFDCGTERSK